LERVFRQFRTACRAPRPTTLALALPRARGARRALVGAVEEVDDAGYEVVFGADDDQAVFEPELFEQA
jgi:hypothetical protein